MALNINYTSWNSYLECPKKYFLKYRKKVKSRKEKNDYFSLYGRLIEKFFTLYCNNWKFKTSQMSRDEIHSKMSILYKSILDNSVVDWTESFITMTMSEILEKAVINAYSILNSENKTIFMHSKSETEITIYTSSELNITGRMDFIYNDPDGKIMIFDGKGTNKIGKGVNKNQLLFYALLYKLHYKILPSQLGFFYYQFNTMVPVDINLNILNEFRARLSLSIKDLQSCENFIGIPSTKTCTYCEYSDCCESWMNFHKERIKPSKIQLPESESNNIQEFGFI